jgi:hypothetical protein
MVVVGWTLGIRFGYEDRKFIPIFHFHLYQFTYSGPTQLRYELLANVTKSHLSTKFSQLIIFIGRSTSSSSTHSSRSPAEEDNKGDGIEDEEIEEENAVAAKRRKLNARNEARATRVWVASEFRRVPCLQCIQSMVKGVLKEQIEGFVVLPVQITLACVSRVLLWLHQRYYSLLVCSLNTRGTLPSTLNRYVLISACALTDY